MRRAARLIAASSAPLWCAFLLSVAANPLPAQARGPATALGAAASRVAALLIRGTEPVKGLPGFGDNAFAAIYGEYALGEAVPPVRVWATREPLYFHPDVWKERSLGGYAGLERVGDDGNLFAATLPGLEWTVLVSFSGDELGAAGSDRFFRGFLNRFSLFVAGAKLPTDVSFPATFDV